MNNTKNAINYTITLKTPIAATGIIMTNDKRLMLIPLGAVVYTREMLANSVSNCVFIYSHTKNLLISLDATLGRLSDLVLDHAMLPP